MSSIRDQPVEGQAGGASASSAGCGAPVTDGARSLLARLGVLHPCTCSPVLLLGATLALLSLERLVILVAMPQRFAAAHPLELVWAFFVGLRFDVVIGAMVAAPLVVLLALTRPGARRGAASGAMERRWVQRVVVAYVTLALAGTVFLCIGDFYFFREFGQRLNERVFQYAKYDYIWLTLLAQLPILPALVVVMVAGCAAARLVLQWGFHDRDHRLGPMWQGVLWPVVIGVLLALAIRGSVGPRPLNAGPAFFSNSPAVAQLALNGGFTLREAAVSRYVRPEGLGQYYELLPPDHAFEVARRTLASKQDRFLGDADNPLRRVTQTDRPRRDYNVVLVVMESMSWHYVGAMGGMKGLTPNLDQLIGESVFMERCFAVGERTSRGVTGIVAGFPDLPGDSVSTRPGAERNFSTLGQVLKDRGYETMFMYGGQPYYDHRQAFLGGNGYERFVLENEFATHTFRTDLGWCDGDLFRTAHEVFAAHDGEEPFFATLLTLSFHRPFAIPPAAVEPVAPDDPNADQLNAVRYADREIGRFMARAREADYYEDTIFVFVADHPGGFAEDAPNPASFRVPLLIHAAPAVLAELGEPARRVSAVCSQTDVAPTVLSLLGGRYEHTFFGSSVLDRPASEGRALIQPGDGSLVYVDDRERVAIVPPFDGEARLLQFQWPAGFTVLAEDDGADAEAQGDAQAVATLEAYRERAVALLQSADLLYQRRAYHVRPPAASEPATESANAAATPRQGARAN